MPLQKLLTPQQVCGILGISIKTLYDWTSEGFIPHIKVGRKLMFDPSKISTWLAKRECKGRVRRTPQAQRG